MSTEWEIVTTIEAIRVEAEGCQERSGLLTFYDAEGCPVLMVPVIELRHARRIQDA